MLEEMAEYHLKAINNDENTSKIAKNTQKFISCMQHNSRKGRKPSDMRYCSLSYGNLYIWTGLNPILMYNVVRERYIASIPAPNQKTLPRAMDIIAKYIERKTGIDPAFGMTGIRLRKRFPKWRFHHA
jgi:hypothetical protein